MAKEETKERTPEGLDVDTLPLLYVLPLPVEPIQLVYPERKKRQKHELEDAGGKKWRRLIAG